MQNDMNEAIKMPGI